MADFVPVIGIFPNRPVLKTIFARLFFGDLLPFET